MHFKWNVSMPTTPPACVSIRVCNTSPEMCNTHRQMFFINSYYPSAWHVRVEDTLPLSALCLLLTSVAERQAEVISLYTEALLQEDRHYTALSAWAVLLRDNTDPLIECFGGCQSANRSFGVIRRWIEQAAFSFSPLCFQKKKKGKLLRDKQQQLCAVTLWWKDTWQKVLIAVGILDWFFLLVKFYSPVS